MCVWCVCSSVCTVTSLQIVMYIAACIKCTPVLVNITAVAGTLVLKNFRPRELPFPGTSVPCHIGLNFQSSKDTGESTLSNSVIFRAHSFPRAAEFRYDETPHRAHRTTSRRERWITGRFTPSSVRPIGRFQCFLFIQLKPSMYFGAVHGALFPDTRRIFEPSCGFALCHGTLTFPRNLRNDS